MKLKKIYKHDNKKQIWRVLPTTNNYVVVEERDNNKEVFFSCFNLDKGKKIFDEFQLDEKNWCGIETICNDIIFFHNYTKPDMPNHKSIIAFDIKTQTILWKNDNYVFSFLYDEKIYCYQQKFESRDFYALDIISGNIIEELKNDSITINKLKMQSDGEFYKQNYIFPEYFNRQDPITDKYQKYLHEVLVDNVIKGDLSYLIVNDLLMFNYHEVNKDNTFNNIFTAVDLLSNKIVLQNTLDENLINLMPESFFVKDDFLFLIVDKTKLLGYKII